VADERGKLKKTADHLLRRLCGSPASVEILAQALAATYSKDIKNRGFIRTPFVLALEHKIARNFARHEWHSLFFPVLVSSPAIDICRLVTWLAKTITGNAPQLVRTELQLLQLLQGHFVQKETRQPIVLVAFDAFNESLLCAVAEECRERKVVLMATQEVQVPFGDDRYRGLPNWTAKLCNQYIPEAIIKTEIERQSMWRDKDVTDIAKDDELRKWVIDADMWADGELPLSDMAAELSGLANA
jgi:hypothetical protein